MSLGPWFKCFHSDILNAMKDMDARKQGFYCQIIFRMYEAADAIYADDRTIGRWCNSNARPWVKIKQELIAEGRLVELSDGGLINPRALAEMTEQAQKNKQVPAFIRERLEKLSQMFDERFAKDSRKISETVPKKPLETKPLIEARSQKPETIHTARDVREALMKAAGLTEQDLMTRPSLVSPIELIHLTNPASGEPCDLEQDIIPAVQRCVAQLKARGQSLTSWSYCREAAIRNRDQRLTPAPTVQQRGGGTPGGPPGQSTNPALRVLSQLQEASRGQDHQEGLFGTDEDFVIDHEPMAEAGFG